MSTYAYLSPGLLDASGGMRPLDAHVDEVARAWLAAAVLPDKIELMSEHLARLAAELGDVDLQVSGAGLLAAVQHCAPPAPLVEMTKSLAPLTPLAVAAYAVHLLDIAERMALLVFLPELPAMSAKADRTGDAARHAGQARHLKG